MCGDRRYSGDLYKSSRGLQNVSTALAAATKDVSAHGFFPSFATVSNACAKKIRSRTKALSDNSLDDTARRSTTFHIEDSECRRCAAIHDEEGTYREMLKEPRPEDVRRNLRKDTPLLLVLLARRVVVFLASTLAATDTRVTRVTCNSKKRAKVITCRLGISMQVYMTVSITEKLFFYYIRLYLFK